MFTRVVENAEVGVSVKAVMLGSSKLFTSYLTPSLHVFCLLWRETNVDQVELEYFLLWNRSNHTYVS